MTQPTIDEMLETLRKLDLLWSSTMKLGSADRETGRRVQAIRAILEREKAAEISLYTCGHLANQVCSICEDK